MKKKNRGGITVALMIIFAIVCVGVIFFASRTDASAERISKAADLTVLKAPVVYVPELPDPYEVDISAENAIVYYVNKGHTLYLKTDGSGKVYPASTTKLFTALTALRYLSSDTEITVGEEVGFIHPLSSRAGLYYGQKLSVSDVIKGMLLPSGNDAAYVIAVAAGRVIAGDESLSAREALSTFVEEMNRMAESSGLENTHFTCPDGIHDDDHYTSIFDMVKIATRALDNSTIAEAAALESYSGWTNTNKLLDPTSKYYVADAIGLKTGYTGTAGNCLVAAFEKNGKRYIVCVYGCETSADRFEDAITLYNKYCV